MPELKDAQQTSAAQKLYDATGKQLGCVYVQRPAL